MIHLHLASLYAQNTFKKIAKKNAHWTNYWISIEGAWAPWQYMYFYNWLTSWQYKNLEGVVTEWINIFCLCVIMSAVSGYWHISLIAMGGIA